MKPLTKKELVRNEWLRQLRTQGRRQCYDTIRHWEQVCAIGLIAEIAKADILFFSEVEIGAQAGLTHEEVGKIVNMNDGFRMSFAEIADEVERWKK